MMHASQVFCVPGSNISLDDCPADCSHLVLPSSVPVTLERAVPYDGIGVGNLGPPSTAGMPATCRVMYFYCDSSNTCLFGGLQSIVMYNQILGDECNGRPTGPQ